MIKLNTSADGRINVSAKLFKQLGLSYQDTVYIVTKQGYILMSVRPVKNEFYDEYTIDKKGNIRIRAEIVRNAGINGPRAFNANYKDGFVIITK